MSKEKVVTIILGFFTVLASILFWRVVSLILTLLQTNTKNVLTLTLGFFLSLIFLLIATALVSALVESKRVILGIFLLSALPSLTLFLFNSSFLILNLITTLAFFATLVYFAFSFRHQVKLHTKFSTSHLFSSPLKNLVVLLALILSFNFYFFATPYFREVKIEIPPPLLEQILNMTLSPQKFPEVFEKGNIPPEMFQQFFGKEGLESSPLLDPTQIKKELENQLNLILKPYLKFLPIIFSTSVFFTLRLSSPIIAAIAALILGVLIRVLLKLKILTLKKEMVEVERLSL